jgi:NDP-sugar pyrophosphorylase family protein
MDNSQDARGIVLAGNYHWSESTFERLTPRALLPVAEVRLIEYVLDWLREGGIGDATICTNGDGSALNAALGAGARGLSLDYYQDATPRGTAGCARDAALLSDASTFLVADGTTIPAVDLDALFKQHRDTGAAVTVVGHFDGNGSNRSGPRPLTPAGIYLFARRALEQVPETSFHDIKEGLIPRLHRKGEKVLMHLAPGVCPRILDSGTYLAVSDWMVRRAVKKPRPGYRQTGDALVHDTATLHPDARLVGPILVGRGARIGAGATVVGPATIGAHSSVAGPSLVSRSVLWTRCVVAEGAVVDRCLLADEAVVNADESLFGALRTRRAVKGPAPAPETAFQVPEMFSARAFPVA